jgi:hypothetical protein
MKNLSKPSDNRGKFVRIDNVDLSVNEKIEE